MIQQYETNKEVYDGFNKELLTDLQCKILANRLDEFNPNFLNPNIKDIQKPHILSRPKALNKIEAVMKSNGKIIFFCDYDVDGATSSVILYKCFKEVFNYNNVFIVLSDRTDGYGITNNAVKLINEKNPNLVITADLGSSDSENIQKINCDVIVTDHHLVPEGGCNAYAVINPHLNEYDSNICGCAVAWLLMAGLASSLKIDKPNKLFNYLDYVAVATIADMVPMNSITNRFFVKSGLKLINQHKRMQWDMLPDIDEEYIGFQLAPKINASSRMTGKPTDAVKYLINNEYDDVVFSYEIITKLNNDRKEIESNAIKKVEYDNSIIIYYDKDNHPGVQGIIAGKLANKYNTPAIVLSDLKEGIIAGSARSNDMVHIRDYLEEFDKLNPDIMKKYGGHKNAAGFSIYKEKLDEFIAKFKEFYNNHEKDEADKVVYYDMELNEPNYNVFYQIQELKPFGMKFKKPLFKGTMKITKFKIIGKDKNHCNMKLNDIQAVYFNSEEDFEYLSSKDVVTVLYTISENDFYGKRLQLMIEKIIK